MIAPMPEAHSFSCVGAVVGAVSGAAGVGFCAEQFGPWHGVVGAEG